MNVSTRSTLVPLLVLTLLAGCASTSRWPLRAAVASQQLSENVERLQLEIIDLKGALREDKTPVLGAGDYDRWQNNFATLAKAGLAVNQAIRDGNTATFNIQVQAALKALDTMMKENVVRLPANIQLAVRISIETVRSVLTSLSIIETES